MDVMGTLVGSAANPSAPFLSATEATCRQECCNAPSCNAYAFSASLILMNPAGAPCYLYNNVTALVPNSGVNTGTLYSAYS